MCIRACVNVQNLFSIKNINVQRECTYVCVCACVCERARVGGNLSSKNMNRKFVQEYPFSSARFSPRDIYEESS